MENFIQIKGVKYTVDPTNDKEFNECIMACLSILGVMCFLGTAGIKDEKTRVEKMLKMAGEFGGHIGKRAIMMLANSTPEKDKGGQDA